VKYEPLEWARLLWCCNHPEPVPMYSGGCQRRYFCDRDFVAGRGSVCLVTHHRFIDEPLTSEVLRQLDFTPYAEEALAKLEAEASLGKVEVERREREITAMERKLENLRSYLGCGDPDREEVYWEQYRVMQEQLGRLQASPLPQVTTAPADIAKVKNFLAGLPSKWTGYSSSLRNRLLKLLIERVELRHEGRRIEATILWKAGFEQRVVIQRPKGGGSRDNRWTDEENRQLKTLWSSATKDELQAALPGRSWQAITNHATRLELRRERHSALRLFQRRWTLAEESRARSLYEAGVPVAKNSSGVGPKQKLYPDESCWW